MRNRIATSQLALHNSACDLVYATSGYDVTSGLKAALTVAVNG